MIRVKLDCPKCKNDFFCEIEEKDLVEDQRVERSMGWEIESSLSQSQQCPFCGKSLDVIVFEYPEGVYEATANEAT